MAAGDGLPDMAIAQARATLEAGDPERASQWLGSVALSARPKDLAAAVAYELGKAASDRGGWGEAERAFADATGYLPTPLSQRRLALTRRRSSVQEDGTWAT